MNQYLWFIIAMVLGSASMPGLAETVYVGDSIMIGIHQGQSPDSPTIELVPTGTPLNIISRDNELTQIETADGVTGWVENKYLSADLPARVRVDALRAENDRLQSALERAEQSRIGKIDALNERIAQLENANKALPAAVQTSPGSGDNGLLNRLDIMQNWPAITICLLIVLGVGVALGAALLDYINRRRHGGFRV